MATNQGTRVVLEWRDIRYTVRIKQPKGGAHEDKVILHGISGLSSPGELVAVLGPSGAGKSTLLDILSMTRKTDFEGELLVNGERPGAAFRRLCGYVAQHQSFLESLTVRETLRYAARLRLSSEMSRSEKYQRVEEVLLELDLLSCADSRIGNADTGGISGGERRRLSVALELLYRPPMLLLDEPTSGLDAASAMRLVVLLRQLASKQGVNIVCTIHQPRASLLTLFDKLLVLAMGRTVYFGPSWSGPGREDGVLAFLRDAGFRCPPFENPADFLLDLINTEHDEELAAAEQQLEGDATPLGSGLELSTTAGVPPTLPVQVASLHSSAVAPVSAETSLTPAESAEKTEEAHASAHVVVEVAAAEAERGWAGDSRGDVAQGSGTEETKPASRSAQEKPPLPPAEGPCPEARDAEQKESDDPPVRTMRTSSATAQFLERMRREEIALLLCERYAGSELSTAMLRRPSKMPPSLTSLEGGNQRKYPTSWWTQFWVVACRSFFYKLREPVAAATQAVNSVLIPAIVGSVYWDIGLSQAGITDRVAAISFLLMLQAFMAIDAVVLWPKERMVYLRDQSSGMYCTSAFYAGRTVAEMPLHTLFGVAAALLSSFMFGLETEHLAIWTLIVVLVTLTGAALLNAVGAMAKNMEQGNALASVVLVVFALFNGFFVNKGQVPIIYHWIYEISFLGKGGEAALKNELEGLTFTCTPEEQELGCIPTGEAMLRRLDLEDVSVTESCIWLVVMILFYRVAGYFGLRFMYTGRSFWERLRE